MNVERYSDKEDKLYTFYPFIKYNNHNFFNSTCIIENAEKHLKAVKEFDSLENDVILATPLKSGTHWVHEIMSMLLTQQTDYNNAGTIMDRNFEALLDLKRAKYLPQPRLFHTHMPVEYLPRKHIENGYKIVQLNRNPMDRHVSSYLFMLGKTGVPNWSWSDYFEHMVMGDGDLFNGWFMYTKQWEDAKLKYPDNIYSLRYEWLIKDPRRTVTELAKFLNVPHTDEFVQEIVKRCSFDNLKNNKIDASRCIHPEKKSTLFRKGKMNDWKNWFTVTQHEQFEELYKKEMAGYDVDFLNE